MSLLLVSLFILSLISTARAGCSLYTGTVCQQLATSTGSPLYLENILGSSFADTDSILIALGLGNLTQVAGAIDPLCAEAAVNYICPQGYHVCQDDGNGTQVPRQPCHSVCDNFRAQCSDVLNATGNANQIPTCQTSDPPNCLPLNFSSKLPEDFKCPSPLVLNPNPEINLPTCVGYCCVPCPQTHYFYKTGLADAIDKAVLAVSVSSFICSIVTILSYSLMPEKRSFPSVVVLCLGISLFITYFPTLLLIGDPNRVRCVTPVIQALPGQNTNSMCLFQATFVLYGFLCLVFWFFILMTNIYMNVIFHSQRLRDVKWWIQAVVWSLPWLFIIISQAMHETGYVFGISCMANNGTFLNGLILIPIACLLFPAVFMNFHVLLRIATVGRSRNASLMAILRLQIRSFFFVATSLLIFLFYWIFIEVGVNPLVLDPYAVWVRDWFYCIATKQGQDACAAIAVGHVPEIIPFAISELLVYGLGFVILGFFVLKKDVLMFWKDLLSGNGRRIKEMKGSPSYHSSDKGASKNKSELEMPKTGASNPPKTDDDDLA